MKKHFAAVAVAVVAAVAVIGVATAAHTVTADSHSTIVNGWDPKNKPVCPGGTVNGGRIESVANGLFGKVEIYGFNGYSFNWRIAEPYDGDGYMDDPDSSTHIDMAVVLVKGGPSDLQRYNYDFAGGGLDDYDEGERPKPSLAAPHAPLLPDLVMPALADIAATFAADGTRKIQFSASIANTGDGPFVVHGVRSSPRSDQWLVTQRFREPDGSTTERPTTGTMTWGGHGHNHWHVKLGATYRLEPIGRKGETLRKLVKAGYCFFDNEPFRLELAGAPVEGVYPKGTCSTLDDEEFEMGLSVGWEDPYYWILPDQSIDITGLPDGNYRLVARADPDDWFDETNEHNNEVWATLRLSERDDGALRYGPGATPSAKGQAKTGTTSGRSNFPAGGPGHDTAFSPGPARRDPFRRVDARRRLTSGDVARRPPDPQATPEVPLSPVVRRRCRRTLAVASEPRRPSTDPATMSRDMRSSTARGN